MTLNKKNRKGFTLTELIVVIVIIGILAAVLIPTLTGYIKKANQSADEQKVRNLNTLLVDVQVNETDFNNALELKDYLKNEMGYNGDYKLKIEGSYMWYDSKEREIVIVDETDKPALKKLAAVDEFDFVETGSLKSPEGLMQYSNGDELWLIGGNGDLVKLVDEIRNIGNNGQALTEYNKLSDESDVKAVLKAFFNSYVFSGTNGVYKVNEDGTVVEYVADENDGMSVIYSTIAGTMEELFHQEVIVANLAKINKQLEDDNAPVKLELQGKNVKVIISDTSGLSYAATAVFDVVKILKSEGCTTGFMIPKEFNSVKDYETDLSAICDAYNSYNDGGNQIISEVLYNTIKNTLELEDNATISLQSLSQFYKVNIESLSGLENNSLTPEQLLEILPSIFLALNLQKEEVDNQTNYTITEIFEQHGQGTAGIFYNRNEIRIIGNINSSKYGRLNVQYDFSFELSFIAPEPEAE